MLALICASKQSLSTYEFLGGWAAGLGPDGMLGSLSIGAIRSLSTGTWLAGGVLNSYSAPSISVRLGI